MPEIQIAASEDFSFDRTVRSHGWFDLPPFSYDRDGGTLAFAYIDDATESVVAVTVRAAPRGLVASVSAGGAKAHRAADVVRAVLRLDQDLAPLRAALAGAPELVACVDAGGGRLMRAPTVFEDVMKMLCTTNCSWGLTRVMVERLVDKAGARGPGGARAFPTAASLARKPVAFFRDVVRAGYRAPYLKELATRVASGALELESLRGSSLPSDEVYARLRSIVGHRPLRRRQPHAPARPQRSPRPRLVVPRALPQALPARRARPASTRPSRAAIGRTRRTAASRCGST